MDLTLIPVILLLSIVFLSSHTQDKNFSHYYKEKREAGANVVLQKVEKGSEDPEADYKTIFNFITSVYKSITREDAQQIARHLVDYGNKYNLDPKFAAAVMARESGFNKKAVSSTGAKGLGQIKDFNFPSLKIEDPFDIKQNVSGTTQYLKRMIGKWQNNSNRISLGLASYFKGFGALSKEKGEIDKKTQGYVDDILKYYERLKVLRDKL